MNEREFMYVCERERERDCELKKKEKKRENEQLITCIRNVGNHEWVPQTILLFPQKYVIVLLKIN